MTSSTGSKFNVDMDFDEWAIFVFNHPVEDDIRSAWYHDENLYEFWDEWDERCRPEKQLEHVIQLFQNPAFLLKAYSPEQINQGFWFLLSGQAHFSLVDIIWNPEVYWPLRQQCILAMANVFQVIFTALPKLDACYMWWDLLRGGKDSDIQVKETMLQAMSVILQMPSLDFQISALHGLGHLKHSGTKTVIDDYLMQSSNVNAKAWPDMDITIREYALAAIEGKVL